ncbi:putative carbonic anhydrase 1 [Patella vulgata]|uniref:putative carbonic anhydrase 1 n=1 Tax=Patella vulgata TaxID=6465 RepID=UPI00217FA135|nr:putative carbonic anhydrase 1 [Patella vulgata]
MGVLGICCLTVICFVSVSRAFPNILPAGPIDVNNIAPTPLADPATQVGLFSSSVTVSTTQSTNSTTSPPLLTPAVPLPRPSSLLNAAGTRQFPRLLCYASEDSCFSYGINTETGPSCWYAIDEPRNRCCDEGGLHQSPISLPASGMIPVIDKNSFLYYDIAEKEALEGRLENNGVGPKWIPERLTARLIGAGDPKKVYVLDNVNIQFGAAGGRQTEHVIEGQPNWHHVGELQIVHFNQAYDNLAAASQFGDGVIIISLMLSSQEGEENEGLKEVIEKVADVSLFSLPGVDCQVNPAASASTNCPVTKTNFTFPDYLNLHTRGNVPAGMSPLNGVKVYPNIMLPKDPEFYSYQGSLTTPPCSEAVTWLVAEKPIRVKPEMVGQLRMLESRQKMTKIYNYGNLRPLQTRTTQHAVTMVKYKQF